MTTTPRAPRPQTDIDRIAEGWIDASLDLHPEERVYLGRPGREGEYGDTSPAGHAAHAEAARAVIRRLAAATPVDVVDEVTRMDLTRELELDVEMHDAGVHLSDLNVIASPAQGIREVFDISPTATEDDWAHVATRLGNVAGAVDGYIETLREGVRRGQVPAKRQIREVLGQVERQASPDGFFRSFAAEARPDAGELPASLRQDVGARAEEAREAYERLASFLGSELEPAGRDVDAVGREQYALRSRSFLGAEVDLDETYEWGVGELARMVEEQESIAREILPGASVLEAIAHLDGDASRKLHGTDALRAWMQETSDRAVEELGRTHFDIPEEIRALECMIAPTQEGGIYYSGPGG
jgi:uncharacterized protein (DUF885 family)